MNFEDRKTYEVKYFMTGINKDEVFYLNMAVTAPDREGNMKDIMVSVKGDEFYGIGYDEDEDDYDDDYADRVRFQTLSTLLCRKAIKNNIDPSCLKFIDSLDIG